MPKVPDRFQPSQTVSPLDSDTGPSVWDEALDWLLLVEAAPADAELRLELEHWLAKGTAQQAAYARAQEIWRLTGGIPPAHRMSEMGRPMPRRTRRAPLWIAGVAIAAGVMLAGLPYLRVQILADYRTATGETRRVALPDGSTVTLDSGSAIDLGGALVEGTGKAGNRTVTLLAGRAYFEVKHDDSVPFAVMVEDVMVQVHGTAFDLGLAKSGISVALERGAVSLTGPGGTGASLRPGDWATFDRRQHGWQIGRIAAEGIAAWRVGKLIVHSATVAEVVAELDRYRPGLILLQDRALAAREVTGVFDLRDPAAALRALLQPFGGRITAITPYLLIVEGA